MVKLLLNYSVTRLPIKRLEITKHIFNGNVTQKEFSDVFNSAKKILNHVSKIQMLINCIINLGYTCRFMD